MAANDVAEFGANGLLRTGGLCLCPDRDQFKIIPHPLTADIAFSLVEEWLAAPNSQWLGPDHSHLERVKTLLLQTGTGGNIVTRAQIAAYAQQYNATICSADADFVAFPING